MPKKSKSTGEPGDGEQAREAASESVLEEAGSVDLTDAVQEPEKPSKKRGKATTEEVASPETPPPPAFIEEKIQVRHNFNNGEKIALGESLAQLQTTKNTLEGDLKSVSADYRNRIKKVQLEIDHATDRIQTGFEMRDCAAYVLHKRDEADKFYYRKDDGSFIRKDKMTDVDFSLLSPGWPKGHKPEDTYLPGAAKKKRK